MCNRKLHWGYVLVLAPIVLIVFITAIVFAAQAGGLPVDARIQGTVAQANCTQVCTAQGCWYDGVVTLAFVWNSTDWRVVADPQPVCDTDCCAALAADQTPIWIELNNDNPRDVSDFNTTPPERATLLGIGAGVLFGEALLITAALLALALKQGQ